MFQLSSDDPEQRATDTRGIHDRLIELVGVVAQVNSIIVAPDLGLVGEHWDLVLVSEHDSIDDLDAYQVHPAHREAADWISTVVTDRAAVDYEY